MAQIVEAQGAEGGAQVVLDRVLAQVVTVADLRDRQAPRSQADDLPLPPGQRRQRQREGRVVRRGRQRTVATIGARLPALSQPSWTSGVAMLMARHSRRGVETAGSRRREDPSSPPPFHPVSEATPSAQHPLSPITSTATPTGAPIVAPRASRTAGRRRVAIRSRVTAFGAPRISVEPSRPISAAGRSQRSSSARPTSPRRASSPRVAGPDLPVGEPDLVDDERRQTGYPQGPVDGEDARHWPLPSRLLPSCIQRFLLPCVPFRCVSFLGCQGDTGGGVRRDGGWCQHDTGGGVRRLQESVAIGAGRAPPRPGASSTSRSLAFGRASVTWRGSLPC